MIVKGQKINDRYEILKTIGEGGMANVYLADDTILDRKVAIKVLRGDLSGDDKFVRRFQREALAASSLSHPNIVEIYDVGEDSGDYFIVMEYVPGKNLKQLLKKRNSLTVPEVIDIMLQITSAMSVAHDSLIIHRDLKPQNILIMDDGGIKITDFGIAMAMNSTQLTQTNTAMGSVHYFPPEQANGKGSTLKSDVYSLGIMMYELLSGTLPFRGDNAVEIALKHLKEPFPSIRDEVSNLPQSVENIIITATAKNPKNRYANANEMHSDLETCLNEERLREPKKVLKFTEGELEEVEYVNRKADVDNSIVTEIKDDEEGKSNKKIIILSAVFGVLILALIFVFLILPGLTEVPDVTIPDVSNLTVVEAERKLKNYKLDVEVEVKEEASDGIEEGKVIRTDPVSGRLVKEGTKIVLVVSTGKASYTVEDFTGEDFNVVKANLEVKYGLVVTSEEKEVEETTDKKYKADEIVGQSVNPGTVVRKGDSIILFLPKVLQKYPDFTDGSYTVVKVQSWCDARGITLKIEYVETSEHLPDEIISQDRAKDAVATSGATLKIKVAKAITTPTDDTD